MASFAVRFAVLVLVSFLLFGLTLFILFNHGLGTNYADHVATLSGLRQKIPAVIALTVLLEAVAVSVILLLLALFWAHAVAGPLLRVTRMLGAPDPGKAEGDIVFRQTDQLHRLAEVIRGFQQSGRSRAQALARQLAEAEKIVNGKDVPGQKERLRVLYLSMKAGVDGRRDT